MLLIAAVIAAGTSGCSHAPPVVRGSGVETESSAGDRAFAAELEALADRTLAIVRRHRVEVIAERTFTHDELMTALARPLAEGRFTVTEAGRSIHGRSILAIRYGRGPVRVLLWSQMHGDESTATMALLDLIAWLAAEPDDELARHLAEELTIVMIPMLNPDGAEIFQRRNAAGVDVNRDARRLATPEGRILKAVRDEFEPDFGFNLHDQNPHTRAGRSGERAAFALLAPAADPERSWTPVRARARLVAAAIAVALETRVPGRVARYGDAFNPRAFGDLMQQWGTSTVLIETGVLDDDPEKQELRTLNGMALLTALSVIAAGDWQRADPARYEALPANRGFAHDFLIRGGMVVLGSGEPLRLDLALAWEDGVRREGLVVSDVGDLEGVEALEVIDATGLYLHPDYPPGAASATDSAGDCWLIVGEPVVVTLRRGPERGSGMVMRLGRD